MEYYADDDETAADLIVAGQDNAAVYEEDALAASSGYGRQAAQQVCGEGVRGRRANGQEVEVPEAVRSFIMYFHNAVLNNNVYELHGCYENQFNKLTEKYYLKSPWPEAEVIAPLVGDDPNFLILYRELYFRHVYARLQPTLEQRIQSYENYCDLFNFILNSEGPVDLELPTNWAWDICDEFIYQYQAFCTYRMRTKRLSDEEVLALKENAQVWSSYSVLNVLYSLIQKSKMNEQLAAMKAGEDANSFADEYGSRPLYKMLGYFGIIGLLRVHCLLGDFTLALKMMDNIELNKKTLFARVTACHFTTYYYVGFAYMMMNRYSDAIRAFSHILLYVARTGGHRQRNVQFDQVSKKGDQMYALLAISVALCPTRLDDLIHSQMRDKYGEQLARMQRSVSADDAVPVFEQLFNYASPKFICPLPPDYDSKYPVIEPQQHHLNIFMANVRSSLTVPQLRSNLRLYSSISLEKAAEFLNTDADDLRSRLLVYKQKTRQVRWAGGSILSGEVTTYSELDIALKNDIIHVAEAKTGRRFGEYFTRNILKYYAVQDSLAG